jgi:hypothetical protein
MLTDKNVTEMQQFQVIPDKFNILGVSHNGNYAYNRVSKLLFLIISPYRLEAF